MGSTTGRPAWTVVACAGLFLVTGCGGGSPGLVNGSFLEHSLRVIAPSKINEEAKKLETTAPDQSLLKYQQVVDSTTIDHPYEYYQVKLGQSAEAMQSRMKRSVSEDESLGVIKNYELKVRNIIEARLGLARLYMNKQAYREARAEIQQAVMTVSQIGTAGNMRYLANVEHLPKIYELLVEIETRAGLPGSVHIAKLDKQSLEEYGRSQLGSSDRKKAKTSATSTMISRTGASICVSKANARLRRS